MPVRIVNGEIVHDDGRSGVTVDASSRRRGLHSLSSAPAPAPAAAPRWGGGGGGSSSSSSGGGGSSGSGRQAGASNASSSNAGGVDIITLIEDKLGLNGKFWQTPAVPTFGWQPVSIRLIYLAFAAGLLVLGLLLGWNHETLLRIAVGIVVAIGLYAQAVNAARVPAPAPPRS